MYGMRDLRIIAARHRVTGTSKLVPADSNMSEAHLFPKPRPQNIVTMFREPGQAGSFIHGGALAVLPGRANLPQTFYPASTTQTAERLAMLDEQFIWYKAGPTRRVITTTCSTPTHTGFT